MDINANLIVVVVSIEILRILRIFDKKLVSP